MCVALEPHVVSQPSRTAGSGQRVGTVKTFKALGDALKDYRVQNPEADRSPVPKLFQPERVLGDTILRKPVDKAAAMLLARAPWWAHAPQAQAAPQPPEERKKPTKHKTKMSKQQYAAITGSIPDAVVEANGEYVSKCGIRVKMVNGEPMFSVDDAHRMVIDIVQKLSAETTVGVKSAQEARRIINELCAGMGGEVEQFRASTKLWLEDIRQTRFAIVSETAAMTGPLKDIRQFFIGADYKEQTARLKEFVELCERLQRLKDSGFLDAVTDTMLRLATPTL